MTEGATTREGFAVLWVAIKREKGIFALSTLGSLLFGALTVADAWVLGWATDHVVLPAFRDGEIEHRPARRRGRAVPRRRHPPRGRHRRPASRRRHHAVPHAGPLPPRRHPPVPPPPHGVAPAPPHRSAALQRQLRRRGRLGPDRPVADGRRHGRDDGHRGRADAGRRRGAGHGGAAGVPGGDHRQRPLPALRLAADDPRAAAARRGQRDRPRVLRRGDGRQDPRPRGGGDPAVRGQGRGAARRQHPRRPHPRGVRPGPRRAPQPGGAARAHRRRGAGAERPDRCRRRRHGRLPADHRVLPDPLDRLAARRVPAQRGRLPTGHVRARGIGRDALRRPVRAGESRRVGRGAARGAPRRLLLRPRPDGARRRRPSPSSRGARSRSSEPPPPARAP